MALCTVNLKLIIHRYTKNRLTDRESDPNIRMTFVM